MLLVLVIEKRFIKIDISFLKWHFFFVCTIFSGNNPFVKIKRGNLKHIFSIFAISTIIGNKARFYFLLLFPFFIKALIFISLVLLLLVSKKRDNFGTSVGF